MEVQLQNYCIDLAEISVCHTTIYGLDSCLFSGNSVESFLSYLQVLDTYRILRILCENLKWEVQLQNYGINLAEILVCYTTICELRPCLFLGNSVEAFLSYVQLSGTCSTLRAFSKNKRRRYNFESTASIRLQFQYVIQQYVIFIHAYFQEIRLRYS